MDEKRDTALSGNVVGKRSLFQATKPKSNMGYDQYTLFLKLQRSNLLLLLSFSTRKHTSMAFSVILLNFFEEQSTQNHLQYLSGCLQVLFPTIFFLTCNFQHNGRIHLDHTRIKTIKKISAVNTRMFANKSTQNDYKQLRCILKL